MDLSFTSARTLYPFDEVSRKLGVRLTVRGGLVRRLVLTEIFDNSELNSEDLLYRLSSFTSDIDTEHSGPPALNAEVHSELVASLPAAACIRLEIRSQAESKRFAKAKKFQATVPVLDLALSSSGIHDPHGGISDVAQRRYRFFRNIDYEKSPLYQNGDDLELFAVLLYIKALLEDNAAEDETCVDKVLAVTQPEASRRERGGIAECCG